MKIEFIGLFFSLQEGTCYSQADACSLPVEMNKTNNCIDNNLSKPYNTIIMNVFIKSERGFYAENNRKCKRTAFE